MYDYQCQISVKIGPVVAEIHGRRGGRAGFLAVSGKGDGMGGSVGSEKMRFSVLQATHVSTNAEMLVEFGSVLAEIFGKICRFLPSRLKRYRNCLCNL